MVDAPALPPGVDVSAIKRAAIGKLGLERFPFFVMGMQIADANKGTIPFQPWPYIMDTAESWGEGTSEIVLKARQLGFTWLAGALAVHRSRAGKHARALLISKGEFDSQQLLERCKFINEHQIPELRQKVRSSNKSELQFANGGVILALPSTENAGRGTQASLVVADESAFHPYAADNFRAYRPAMADGGQLIQLSTSNGPSGFFYEQWVKNRDQESRGVKATMKTRFVPAMGPDSRPDRTQEWYDRERDAYVGLPQAFAAEYPMTPEEAFSQLSGLVYPNFHTLRHFQRDPVPWEECVYRIFGMDLGGGDPTAVVVLGVYKDRASGQLKAHVYGLWYKDDGPPSVEEIFKYLSRWHGAKRFTVGAGDFAPGGATVSASLANMGLPIRNDRPDRKEGIGIVTTFIDKDWLTIRPNDVTERVFRREFGSYRWADRLDPTSKDRYATKTPQDHHGDALDALRSCIVLAFKLMWTGDQGETKFGSVKWTA